jgi:hypothetical protein
MKIVGCLVFLASLGLTQAFTPSLSFSRNAAVVQSTSQRKAVGNGDEDKALNKFSRYVFRVSNAEARGRRCYSVYLCLSHSKLLRHMIVF